MVHALEVLDSRGRPTLQVTLAVAGGHEFTAGVPSGASTGSCEAVELRDGDPARYGGNGVLRAASNVNGQIADAITGRTFAEVREIDDALRELDGTTNKSVLGANAIVGVSMAASRALAAAAGVPLWQHLNPADVRPRFRCHISTS